MQDFLFVVDALPDAGEKYRAREFESLGGGPAATAAVTVARLGGRASLAARVGEDDIADLIVAELQEYGVDCGAVVRHAGCRSSVSAVMVGGGGERMIVNYLDAKLPADPGWLPGELPADVDAVLADTRWPQGAAAMLGLAKAAGRPAVLDADRPVPRDGALLRAATHVAFSADGLKDYTGDEDAERALADVAQELGAWCGVTLGAGGVLHADGDELSREPAFPVEAVDTLGAGDVWHGAFALALAEGRGEAQAVVFATAAAALKVQRPGGRRGVPSRAEVETLLESQARGVPA